MASILREITLEITRRPRIMLVVPRVIPVGLIDLFAFLVLGEIVRIQSFQFVYRISRNTNSKIYHELGQLLTVDQNNLVF